MSLSPAETFANPIIQDPSDELSYQMDWSDWLGATATIVTSTWTITGDGALTKDNESIVSGNQKTQVRLSDGTLGQTYTITNRIVTDETPAQTKEYSFKIKLKNQ